MNSRKLARVVALFQRQQQAGLFPGGQLVVRHRGEVLLDEAVGVARGYRPAEGIVPIPVDPDTPFPVFSVGKPLAAVAIAMLEDRGLLDVNAPIVQIFPDFARHGKEQLTTLDVLTHRSGVLMPDFVRSTALWGQPEAVREALINAVPVYPRGTLAYHPYEYGWLLNEIVTRLDGRSLPDYFEQEIAAPLQLPALRYGLAGRAVDSLAFTYWLGGQKVIVGGVNVATDFEWQNTPRFFAARNPAVSMVTDAGSLATFYDFLLAGGVTPSGQRLISSAILRQYTTRQVLSWDRSLKTILAVGRGFQVGASFPSSFGWWGTNRCFGHGGAFSCLAFGDYSKDLSVAILTNGNRSLPDFTRRFLPLAHRIRLAFDTQR